MKASENGVLASYVAEVGENLSKRKKIVSEAVAMLRGQPVGSRDRKILKSLSRLAEFNSSHVKMFEKRSERLMFEAGDIRVVLTTIEDFQLLNQRVLAPEFEVYAFAHLWAFAKTLKEIREERKVNE